MTEADRLAEIRARAEAASPGESGPDCKWTMTWNMKTGCKIWASRDNPIIQMIGGIKNSKKNEDGSPPQWWKDAEFVQQARTDIPYLLDLVDELQRDRDALIRRLTRHEAYAEMATPPSSADSGNADVPE